MGEQKTKTPRDPGQGQLLQRGKNKWLIRVYDGRDGAGRRRYINETVHGTSKAANARLVEILNGKIRVPTFAQLKARCVSTSISGW